MEQTIGGNRLGSGNNMKVQLHGYERSTHDLGYIWRSTMSAGTLVPFMNEVALPGDTFDIGLDCDVLTQPTIGPLFGSYKIQLDVFQVPMRLYQAELHMNRLGIGRKMSEVKLPLLRLETTNYDNTHSIDNNQINPSCLLSYLGIRGVGFTATLQKPTAREFNAIPYLAYWDIYKCYYANKQEEIGAFIHASLTGLTVVISAAKASERGRTAVLAIVTTQTAPAETGQTNLTLSKNGLFQITGTNIASGMQMNRFKLWLKDNSTGTWAWIPLTEIFGLIVEQPGQGVINCSGVMDYYVGKSIGWGSIFYDNATTATEWNIAPEVTTFPLANIDNMRLALLQKIPASGAYKVSYQSAAPYGSILSSYSTWRFMQFSQEGLALKTYQSDLFNNWIDTEWIDGVDGVGAVTAVTVTDNKFTIDELQLSKKIYDMLNRIAVSGGSYDDWLDVVYTHDRQRTAENPIYLGGLIKNLVFEEVVSVAKTETQPLGTLAGRGRVGSKNKGGKIVVKVDEPSYIMGIISLTPNVDYSQGNKWDVNLKTMDDFHKPGLDGIGFQDLITEQMAWFDTIVTGETPAYKSAGKQPAWTNYMTNVNVVRGNFAEVNQQMFMVLNRRYDADIHPTNGTSIKDLTTYIDPSKFNHIFAQTRVDAQNFWAQVKLDITARRKMSAKVMPNL